MVVHGYEGLDEISTTASTKISYLKENNTIDSMAISPSDFGFSTTTIDSLKGGEPNENAKIILDILNNKDKGPKRDIVILNAGAGILIGGKSNSIENAVKLAEESISSGKALEKLNQLANVK